MTVPRFTYELDPSTGLYVSLFLCKNVTNVKQVLDESKRDVFKCAFLNPKLICDPFQVIAAANRAVVSQRRGTLRTRDVYSEIIYNLSPSTSIKKSLESFGIAIDRDKVDVVVVVLRDDNECPSTEIKQFIKGDTCSAENVCELKDVSLIKKTYNISHDNQMLEKIITICAVKSIECY